MDFEFGLFYTLSYEKVYHIDGGVIVGLTGYGCAVDDHGQDMHPLLHDR